MVGKRTRPDGLRSIDLVEVPADYVDARHSGASLCLSDEDARGEKFGESVLSRRGGFVRPVVVVRVRVVHDGARRVRRRIHESDLPRIYREEWNLSQRTSDRVRDENGGWGDTEERWERTPGLARL